MFLLGLVCIAQAKALSQTNTTGTDFWLGAMQYANESEYLELVISAQEETEVRITSANGLINEVVYVSARSSEKFSLDKSFMPSGSGLFDLGIHINSDRRVSVVLYSYIRASSDATVILPSTALGKEYIIMSHSESVSTQPPMVSEFLIVGVENGTQLEITPTQNTLNGWGANQAQNIIINAGETFQVQANADLSGSVVKVVGSTQECQNIAVFGGSLLTEVGGCGAAQDHLNEQMYPVSEWGLEYFFVPLRSRRGGDFVKIVASQDNTTINVSGETSGITLDRGEVFSFDALENPRSISADKPIMVAQLSRSMSCDNILSDPSMILLNPKENQLKSMAFESFQVESSWRNYLTLVVPSSNPGLVRLDDVDISRLFRQEGAYSYLTMDVSGGNHWLEAPEGVIAYAYGMGDAISYGYSLGSVNPKVEADLVLRSESGIVLSELACMGSEVELSLEFDLPSGINPAYNHFEWDFGDGFSATGQRVNHTYADLGTYTVRLFAYDNLKSCGNQETFLRDIEVTEATADAIEGPVSVCPGLQKVAYKAFGPSDNTYEWFVSTGGGSIASGQGTETVEVNWTNSEGIAYLKAVPRSALGCLGDTVILEVKIDSELQPLLPIGNTDVCESDLDRVFTYSTFQNSGSSYEWEIEGGEFVPMDSNRGNEVQVKWHGSTPARIRYFESNGLVANCSGFSDFLAINIRPPISIESSLTIPSCADNSDGAISLSILGGKPGGYSVVWDNGMNGQEIAGLAAGTYEVTVSDFSGCQLVSNIVLPSPSPLRVDDIQTQPVLCSGESTGKIILSVSGGTAHSSNVYTFRAASQGQEKVYSGPELTALSPGFYDVTVTDSEGCSLAISGIEVGEPPALEFDLETFVNEPICPGEDDGVTYIEAKGGTPDYQIYWSNQPEDNSQTGSSFAQGSHSVKVVDSNGCEKVMNFSINERLPKITIPNAFSPNGDGHNDEFKPVADCALTYAMQIYNQWGTVIYSTEDLSQGWDGKYNGKSVQLGNYSYVIFFSSVINGALIEETYRGELKLIR